MKINVAHGGRCFDPFFHLAMTCLLSNANGQEIRRNVALDLNTERLADSEPSRATKSEQHPFFRLFVACQTSHDRRREARSVLFRLLDQWKVHKLVVPLAWMDLIAVAIDN
jgi:hypothetical protein